MSKIVIQGAGFAWNTAALYLGQRLGKNHQIFCDDLAAIRTSTQSVTLLDDERRGSNIPTG